MAGSGPEPGQLTRKPQRGLMLALNAGGGLGRAVLVVAALLYLTRAAEEFVWFRFSPAIFLASPSTSGTS